MTAKSYDAVVVGGGHNGLVAAAYLARAGKSVLVLEKRDVVGGATLQRLEPEPGYGMITLHVRAEDDDVPDALIVPLGSIRRIELRKSAEERVGFGFSLSV